MSRVVFTNGNIFDGVHNTIIEHAWMLVDQTTGQIINLGPGDAPQADSKIDLAGQYVMPGLINAHTHISLDPHSNDGDGFADIVTVTVRALQNLHLLLQSGVTYIRECGCSHGIDRNLAQLKRTRQLQQVPNIMPAGEPLTMTGGHGTIFHGGNVVDSPDEMRKAVRQNFADGAQCTKVMATGGVMSENDNMFQPQLKVPEIKVAVEETHSKGSIVAAHAEANPGIMNALLAGVDSIEHGDYVTDQEIAMMLKNNVYLTPTLTPIQTMVDHSDELPAWEVDKNVEEMQIAYHNFRNAYRAGVKFTLGTDAGCPFTYFNSTAEELFLMVDKIGMTNFDALSTIRHAAELMKLNDHGSLAKGKQADFLVLTTNPLANIKAVVQSDKQVYQAGVRQF